jgi:uncharacterized membrane protein YsdA (DUF1294 family)/cold shock CspA family protein
MEQRGRLLNWDDGKGFGFIQPKGGGPKLFVHISVMRGDARPSEGDSVLYLAGKDEKGRLRATHMRREGLSIDQPSIRINPRTIGSGNRQQSLRFAPRSTRSKRLKANIGIQHPVPKLVIWCLLCILPLLGSLALYSQLGWIGPLAAYCSVSLVSFFMYRSDKRRAQQSLQRTPENLLHLAELLGGWPGALIAQQILRHKTRKASYQTVFWLVVAAHQLFWADRLLFEGLYLTRLIGG